MIHNSFDLRYKSLKSQNIRYNDKEFNEKRLWISRLLAQLVREEVLILSIDEAGFKSVGPPNQMWMPSRRSILNYDERMRKEGMPNRTDEERLQMSRVARSRNENSGP